MGEAGGAGEETAALPQTPSTGKQIDLVPNAGGIDDHIKLANLKIRQNVSLWIMALFGVVNLFILGLIVWLAVVDQAELAAKLTAAGDRLVNTQVLIALLGATTVQLGTVAVIMARSVFKD